MAFEQFKYQNKYNKEHYARLSVNVPIEKKEEIENHYRKKGYKYFNTYVNDLIQKDMNESTNNSNISVGDISQNGNNNSINIG